MSRERKVIITVSINTLVKVVKWLFRVFRKKKRNVIPIIVQHQGLTVVLPAEPKQKVLTLLKSARQKVMKRGKFGLPPVQKLCFRFGNVLLTNVNRTLKDYKIEDRVILDLLFKFGGD